MNRNNTIWDSLLRSQPAFYWSGEKLWPRAHEIKQELLNDFHSLFCQEVSPQWPVMSSGETMEDLIQQLRLFLEKPGAQGRPNRQGS
jgi:hypothetical protein